MKTRQIFEEWKKDLLLIKSNLTFKEDIINKGTENEEFYFFPNFENSYSFYCFNDNWGLGIGIHRNSPASSRIWYFEDIGITEENEKLKWMRKLMRDVYLGKRIIIKINEENFQIDFTEYPEFTTPDLLATGNKISLFEL